MHETTITVVSMRKDRKGLKAAFDGKEEWMDIPDSLQNQFEWKGIYAIGYTTAPKQNGAIGYAIKKVTPSSVHPGGIVHSQYPGQAIIPPPTNPSNGGAEKGMLTKIAIELKARGLSDDEVFETMRAGRRITARVMAVRELEETF